MNKPTLAKAFVSVLLLVGVTLLMKTDLAAQAGSNPLMDVLNSPSPTINLQDTTAPGTVISLEAIPGEMPGSVDLHWVAPGNDGGSGTATAYVLRYNLEPITETITATNWTSSTDLPGEPLPREAGSLERMTVSGLPAGQLYFAIKTLDGDGNLSALSNIARATATPYVYLLPLVAQPFEPLDPVIPDTTEVLTATTIQYLESFSDDGTLTFSSEAAPALAELDPGDVIATGVSAQTPYGFLRKVDTVTPRCNKVVVETEQATLEDAIESASIEGNMKLTPAHVTTAELAPGVTMNPSPDGLQFEFSLLDFVLFDYDGNLKTKYDQVVANGKLKLDLTADFTLRIEWFTVKEFRFVIGANEEAEIGIKVTLQKEFEIPDKQLTEMHYQPIVIFAGPVPIVFSPAMNLFIGADGSVSVEVSAGVIQKASLRVGAAYENGAWSGIFVLCNNFDPYLGKVTGSLTVRGWIGVKTMLKLYDIAGPSAVKRAYLMFEASAESPPIPPKLSAALYAGLEIEPGAEVSILGKKLASWTGRKYDFRILLWELSNENSPPDTPSLPTPVDNVEGEVLNPMLIWTGGDPDGDTVTYDVFFEKGNPYPGVKVSDDRTWTDYIPDQLLDADSWYFWRIVAKDEHDETASSPIWSFRTGSYPNTLPNAPSAPQPYNDSVNQSIYPQLGWSGGDPDGDTVTYDVYLEAGDVTPTTVVCDDTGNTVCYTDALSMTTLYSWQVVPRDGHGRTNPGPIWHFTTGTSTNQPPYEPGFGETWGGPLDGAINQDLWTVLNWVGYDPDEDPVTYDVYFEAEDGDPDVLLCAGTAEVYCDPGPLAANTGYYWQVVSRDDEGAKTAGPVWHFTTADVVLVEAGEFQMGCDACNPHEQCNADELPLHEVKLSPFVIDRTEVTNAEYAACVADEVCRIPLSYSSRARASYYNNPAYADYPVMWLFQMHAAKYCAWVGMDSQSSVWRLPTEAEWEKAARGSAATKVYPWGFKDPDCSLSNSQYWDGAAYTSCMTDTVAVGSYPAGASPYGALDMSGNLWEWIADVYGSDYYSWSPYEDPQGPVEGPGHVIRGGSFVDPSGEVRTANRWNSDNSEFASDTIGFRCAATAEQNCSPGPDQVSLFIGNYYRGQCVTKDVGEYANPASIGLPNDQISSVKVGTNVQLELCQANEFLGYCEIFLVDDPFLWDNIIGDNTVSSVRLTVRP